MANSMRVVALPEFLARAKHLLSGEERGDFIDYIGSSTTSARIRRPGR
jgi:hypothetical protein